MSFRHEIRKLVKCVANHEPEIRERQHSVDNEVKLFIKVSPDIYSVKDYVAVFSKALSHNNEGIVDVNQIELFLQALETGNPKYIEKLELPGTMKLVDPLAFTNIELYCKNIATFSIENSPPPFRSLRMGSEIIELYEMYLCRDIKFQDFDKSQNIKYAVNSLNKFNNQVNSSNIFRSSIVGSNIGPYVSQFLYLPFKYGAMSIDQACYYPKSGSDYLTTIPEYITCQNGKIPRPSIPLGQDKTYISTMRDLAEFVHNDQMCQAFFNAQLIIQALDVPYNANLNTSNNVSHFVSLGSADITDLMHQASRLALRAAWLRKILLLRVRPENYAFEINRAKYGLNYGINSEILKSETLSRVFDRSGNYLLPTSYAEGSPINPSWPSGHAAIAGAAVTILKAFYDGNWTFPNPVIGDDEILEPVLNQLTLNDELNKLAANMCYGRNMAGIHYRSDKMACCWVKWWQSIYWRML